MRLDNITVQIGGFHDHWRRNRSDNPALLMAALEYYHYDFICLMDGFDEVANREKALVEQWMPGMKVFLGEERCYGWGHVVSVLNDFVTDNPQNPDLIQELDRMRERGGLVALAHIGYPTTKALIEKSDILDELIDGGHVDAVQLGKAPEWRYVSERAAAGKRLPLIGGWDSHLLIPDESRPDILYSLDAKPDGHIDSAPGMRSIVFAETNDFDAILAAVRAGKTVLEEVESGRLYGSPELVELLDKNHYSETMHRLDKELTELRLSCDKLYAHHGARFVFPGAGGVSFAASDKLDIKTFAVGSDGVYEAVDLPMPVMQDESYLPIVWNDGQKRRTWAVRIENDIAFMIKPVRAEGGRALRLTALREFDGCLRFEAPFEGEIPVRLSAGETQNVAIGADVPQIFGYRFICEGKAGGIREYSGKALVAEAPRCSGDWSRSPVYRADDASFAGGFGCNRPWPGKEIFSAETRFAWDEKYFYMYNLIRDTEYVTPPPAHYMYNGDCVQLAVEPSFARTPFRSGTAEFNIGVPQAGPQIWRIRTAADESCPPISGQREAKGYVKLFPCDGGRIMETAVEWDEIQAGLRPESGMHMGIYLEFQNDNGSGLIDAMQWPWPIDGMWMIPSLWGTLCLTD